MRKPLLTLLVIVSVILAGCVGLPSGVDPVQNFDSQRYLGTWYEIARLEHSFEKGLDNITASYSLRDDGGIRVLNRGYDRQKSEWRMAEGKAYPVKSPDLGYLRVSFLAHFMVHTWYSIWMKSVTSTLLSQGRTEVTYGFFQELRISKMRS